MKFKCRRIKPGLWMLEVFESIRDGALNNYYPCASFQAAWRLGQAVWQDRDWGAIQRKNSLIQQHHRSINLS